MACIACLSALVKWCGAHGVPVGEIVFFRNAFAFVPLGLYISRTSGWTVIKTRRPLGHLARSTVGLMGMVCGFSAVQRLPLTDAVAFTFLSPVFMTLMAAPILKEHIGLHRWGAVAAGFVGMLVMIRPNPSAANLAGTALAIVGALGAAAAMVAIREISSTERGPTIVFYFTLAGTVLGLVSLPLGWALPDGRTLAMLVLCGLIGGVGQLLLTEALRRAPVGVIAPFDYSQLLWASLIGFVVWGEVPRLATLAGVAIIAASGGYILYRELRRFKPGRHT
jgi:drug/metabolite transporter (DMT)-like permease